MIPRDNTAIKKKFYDCIERGESLFNKGRTVNDKQSGIQTMIEGLHHLKKWMECTYTI